MLIDMYIHVYIYMYMYMHKCAHGSNVQHTCACTLVLCLSPLQFQRQQHQVVIDGATVHLEIVSLILSGV